MFITAVCVIFLIIFQDYLRKFVWLLLVAYCIGWAKSRVLFKPNFRRLNCCATSVRNCKPLCSARIAELYNDKLANHAKRILERSLDAWYDMSKKKLLLHPTHDGRCLLFCFDIPDLLSQVRKQENALPGQAELSNALRDLEKSSGIDPEGYRVLLWRTM